LRSLVSKEFRKLVVKLPTEVQRQARTAYALGRQNPSHPSLDFKKLKVADAYSARVGLGYRAICVKPADDVFVWEWIGSHAEYDQLVP
jgi:hypothetical protein